MSADALIAAALFALGSLLAASSGAVFRPGAWYERLRKPSWRPPNALFGPVWLVLYVMIAVAGWRVWRAAGLEGAGGAALAVFALQLALNFLWSALFFGARRIGLALVELGLLWISILACVLLFRPIDGLAAALMLPYLLWVSFAFALNFAIWRLNRGATAIA